MRITKKLVDSQGNQLQELDHVMIYFAYNELKPGVVKEIKGEQATRCWLTPGRRTQTRNIATPCPNGSAVSAW